jgi:tetratricopeptide (TPR) repeat protein
MFRRTPTNVLPLVNKALAIFQWKQDMAAAEALCKEALSIDEECDVAVATAAQLSLQQGKIPEAIKWFEQSAKLARTEAEMTAAITCKGVRSHLSNGYSWHLRYRRTRLQGPDGFPAGKSCCTSFQLDAYRPLSPTELPADGRATRSIGSADVDFLMTRLG